MNNNEIEARACEEAVRLYENEFHYYNPYTREINAEGIPYSKQEMYFRLVEEELLAKGEKILRQGAYFKIARYQKN